VLSQALDAARADGDVRLENRARMELAEVRSMLDPNTITDVLPLTERAIPVFESFGDDRALGRAWLLVGFIKGGFYCDNRSWAEASEKAAEHYRRAGWSPAVSLGNLAFSLLYGATPVNAALEKCAGLLKGHVHDHASAANLHVSMGPLEAMRGNFDDARAHVSRARALWSELGQVHATIACGMALGMIEMLADQPEAAETTLRESCAAAEELHEPALLANRAAELADSLYTQGRYDEAEFWAVIAARNSASDDRSAQAAWRGASSKLRARSGAIAEGEKLAQEEIALLATTDALIDQARALLDLAEVLRIAERQQEAHECVRGAIDLFNRKGNVVGAERGRNVIAVAT
jgi:tetratricopeptide (TPR) repeat protein